MTDKHLEKVRTLIARVVAIDHTTDKTLLEGAERERSTAAILACRLIDEHHLLDDKPVYQPAPPPRAPQPPPWERYTGPFDQPWTTPGNPPPPPPSPDPRWDEYYPPPRPKPPPQDAWSPSPPKQHDMMDDVIDAIKDAFQPRQRTKSSRATTPGKSKITTARRAGHCKGCDKKYVAGDKIISKDGYGTVIASHVSCVMGLEAWS